MKSILTGAALMGMLLSTHTFAEESVTSVTTTTSAGTISEFGPKTIRIRTETGSEPVSYVYSKTTTYVDEAGNPVSVETVKSGLPVTVYYTKVGDNMVATKVIVKRVTVVPVTPPAQVIEEKKTTTTTTTETEK